MPVDGGAGTAASARVSGPVASSRAGLPDTIVHSVWIVPARSGPQRVDVDRGWARYGAMSLAIRWLLRPRLARLVPGLPPPTLVVHQGSGDRVLEPNDEPYQPRLRGERAVDMPRPTFFAPTSLSEPLVLEDGTQVRAYAQSGDAGLTVKCDLYVDGKSLEYPGLPLDGIEERRRSFERGTPPPFVHVVAGIVALLVATTVAITILRSAPLDWTRIIFATLPYPAAAWAVEWWLRTTRPATESRIVLLGAVVIAVACAGLLALVVALLVVPH